MKYTEILRLNRELDNNLSSDNYKITIVSNIIVSQIKEILEYYLRIENINATIELGDYDNIVQDSLKYQSSNTVIIFWELCNVFDGLQSKIDLYEFEELDQILEKIKYEIDLVLENLKNTSVVLFNKFSSIHFNNLSIRKNNLDMLAFKLNQYLEQNIKSNIKLVEIEKVISNTGLNNSIDLRYYYSSKALYKIDFLQNYSKYIKPYFFAACGKSKKALIFDCDNTLWKGVLGEDGFENIEMSSRTPDGAIFSEIQLSP